MVTKIKKRKFTGSKKRFIGKRNGQIQARVQAAGPEHFGIVAVDCAKRRSKWLLCNFFGKVLIEPTTVEHTNGGLRAMTQLVAFSAPGARPHNSLNGKTPDEVYYRKRAANQQPRIEPRKRWPRGSPGATPQTLAAGQPGDPSPSKSTSKPDGSTCRRCH